MKEEDDAEAKAKADADAGEDSEEEEEGLASKLVGHLEGLFDMPALAPHKKHVQPLFDLLEQHENVIFGIIAAPLLLLLASFGLLGGSKARALNCLPDCSLTAADSCCNPVLYRSTFSAGQYLLGVCNLAIIGLTCAVLRMHVQLESWAESSP